MSNQAIQFDNFLELVGPCLKRADRQLMFRSAEVGIGKKNRRKLFLRMCVPVWAIVCKYVCFRMFRCSVSRTKISIFNSPFPLSLTHREPGK